MRGKEAVFADGGIRLSLSGTVARLTLSRPETRNSLTSAMWSALPRIAADLAADRSARVLVITGAGDRAFSAGADISEFPKTYANPEAARRYNQEVRSAQAAVATLPIPVIAEIRGACFGGGCSLALHCDLRFADETAHFAITPAKLGLAYSFEDTKRLVSTVGPSRAKDILCSGRTLSSGEAHRVGLIDFVCPSAELGDAVADYASQLSGVSQASIRVAKATVDSIAAGADEADAELRAAFEATFSGPDFAEGCAAFREKRKPVFE